jgi:peptidoglycan hydrolase-like protein with peptidoglycan-binding domain
MTWPATAQEARAALPATSPTVRMAQQALNERGYNVGNVDGVWGPGTADAVRRFQQAQDLPDSGALDTQTLSALGVGRYLEITSEA